MDEGHFSAFCAPSPRFFAKVERDLRRGVRRIEWPREQLIR